ncbi:MAG: hypothetical protein SF172_11080 [Burkholderiales bacterium]|nr:hypothetical protein [Burkholderiales bacterium]
MANKSGKGEFTSPKVASAASKIMRSKTATPAQKSVAASALTQARNRKSK